MTTAITPAAVLPPAPPAFAIPGVPPLRITRLVMHNIKRIRAIDISPTDDVVVIGGKNDQGKSSVLDGIQLALDEASIRKQIPRPIRDGADSGSIDLHLTAIPGTDLENLLDPESFTVSRRYTDNDTSYLEVWAKDGSPVKGGPQTFLDKLLGHISFDPDVFARMSEGDQRATLLQLVKLEVNLDELNAERDRIFSERTDVNRELKKQQGALAKMLPPTPDVPATEVSAADIIAAIQAAQDQRQAHAVERQRLETLRTETTTAKQTIKATDDRIVDLERQLADLRTQRTEQQQRYDDLVRRGTALRAQVDQLVDPDVTPLQAQLTNVERTNAAVRDAQRYQEQAREIQASKAKSEALTAQLKQFEDRKTAALEKAQFPIAGLGFSDTGVTFEGCPFVQLSASKKIRVSLAIGMALNPTVRIIRITDGSRLDDDNLEIVKELARTHRYQIFLESVGEDRPGVIIEDGTVKGAPLPADKPSRRKTAKSIEAHATPALAPVPTPDPTETPIASPAPVEAPPPSPALAPTVRRTGLAAVAPPLPSSIATPARPAAPVRPLIPLRKAVLKKQDKAAA